MAAPIIAPRRARWRAGRAGALAGLLAAGAAAAGDLRGPLPLRGGQVFAQPRPSLPAEAAVTSAPGALSWGVGVLWANSFAWTQDVPGETPGERAVLVDGETATLELEARRGLRPGLELGLRLALHSRGGGVLDGFIDGLH